jgi:2Fe-2S ferredoxin
MELLFDKFAEDWGDCKGRAWCGTCHIKILNKTTSHSKDKAEVKTLSNISDSDNNSRLACQILIDKNLQNTIFKIIKE